MVQFHPTTSTTLPNRTPTSTLHRVFHSSLATIKTMTTILNQSPQPPDVPMPDDPHTPNPGLPPDDDDPFHFTSHFNHHQDRVMTHQMRKCTHHKMNLQIYHHIHHHHQIIHNRFPEPMPYLLHQTRLFHQTLMIHLRHTVPKDHLMIHQYHLRQMLVFNPVSC